MWNDPGLASAPTPVQPQAYAGICAQIGDVAGVAALFGHDPGCVVLDVDSDDCAPLFAGAATDSLDERVSRNEAKMNAEFYGWVEQVFLEQPHPLALGGVFFGHGSVFTMTVAVVAWPHGRTPRFGHRLTGYRKTPAGWRDGANEVVGTQKAASRGVHLSQRSSDRLCNTSVSPPPAQRSNHPEPRSPTNRTSCSGDVWGGGGDVAVGRVG